jgi:hypothetical protein
MNDDKNQAYFNSTFYSLRLDFNMVNSGLLHLKKCIEPQIISLIFEKA